MYKVNTLKGMKNTTSRENGDGEIVMLLFLAPIILCILFLVPRVLNTATLDAESALTHQQITSLAHSIESYAIANPDKEFPEKPSIGANDYIKKYDLKNVTKEGESISDKAIIKVENNANNSDFIICVTNRNNSKEQYDSFDGTIQEVKKC